MRSSSQLFADPGGSVTGVAPIVKPDAGMRASRARWSVVRLPHPVVQWLRDMSARIGVPRHRVLDALLDRYAEQLSDAQRRRLEEEIAPRDKRPQ